MGGKSQGLYKMDENLTFYGRISLENNGGFASIRSYRKAIKGISCDNSTLKVKVKGDGRPYNFNLYPGRKWIADRYVMSFPTKANEWTEVEFPLDQFVGYIMGWKVPFSSLDCGNIVGLGFLLYDG